MSCLRSSVIDVFIVLGDMLMRRSWPRLEEGGTGGCEYSVDRRLKGRCGKVKRLVTHIVFI